MPNGIQTSETVYTDPFMFNPYRFINPETGRLITDPSHAFGRRISQGRYRPFQAVWLPVASLMATFDIEKVKEKIKVVGEDSVEREEERTVEYQSSPNAKTYNYESSSKW